MLVLGPELVVGDDENEDDETTCAKITITRGSCMNPVERPFGAWSSGLTPRMLALAGNEFGQLGAAGNRAFWTELRPRENGRMALMGCDLGDRDAGVREWLGSDVSVRSRVHEYGGGSFSVHPSGVIAFDDHTGTILRMDATGKTSPLHHAQGVRYAEFQIDPKHDRVLAVAEVHDPENSSASTVNYLAVITGQGAAPFRRGADFYASPRISPDGRAVCWIEWDHPHMPWDQARLMVARLDASGSVEEVVQIVSGPSRAPLQPEFGPGRTLTFLSDPAGLWQPSMIRFDRHWRVQTDIITWKVPGECGFPMWQLGTRIYARLAGKDPDGPAGRMFLQWTKGYDYQPAILDLETGALKLLEFPYAQLADPITTDNGWVWFRGISTTRLPEISCYDPVSGDLKVMAAQDGPRGDDGEPILKEGDLSTPEGVSFGHVHLGAPLGIYYPPTNHAFCGPKDGKPPLILCLHGGPTAAASPAFSLKTQFWTQRGFAVLDLNYRGSTGRGRGYREALYDHWGLVDIEDAILAADTLLNRSMASGVVVSGGSAGGFSVLAALAHSNLFAGGCVRYGVTDLMALAQDTHKFEAHYLDSLIGPLPEAEDVYIARSPCTWPQRISVPVLLLQGTEDRVVPLDQARSMATALRSHSDQVYYREFQGEGHGFRRSDSIVGALEAEWAFYARIFGFDIPLGPDVCPIFQPELFDVSGQNSKLS